MDYTKLSAYSWHGEMIEKKVKNGMQNEVSKKNHRNFYFSKLYMVGYPEEITVKNCLFFCKLMDYGVLNKEYCANPNLHKLVRIS